jgi:hypothetical protein
MSTLDALYTVPSGSVVAHPQAVLWRTIGQTSAHPRPIVIWDGQAATPNITWSHLICSRYRNSLAPFNWAGEVLRTLSLTWHAPSKIY